jgi:hypothetical protein
MHTAQQKHVIQYKTNTHPDKPMHTSLCFDLWTSTSASLRTHCHRTRGQNRKKDAKTYTDFNFFLLNLMLFSLTCALF